MGKESGAIGIAFPFPRKSLFRDLAQQKKKKTCIASSGVCGVSRLWCNCTHWIVRTLFSLSSAYICMHRQFTEWSHGARQFTLAVAQVVCCGSVCALIFRSLSEEWGAWPNGQSWVFTLWVLLLLFPHKQTTAEQFLRWGLHLLHFSLLLSILNFFLRFLHACPSTVPVHLCISPQNRLSTNMWAHSKQYRTE